MSDQVITDYKKACQKRYSSRNLVAITLLLVILFYVGLFYLTLKEFRTSGLVILSQSLQEKAVPILSEVTAKLPEIAGRVIPAYIQEVGGTIQKNNDEIRNSMLSEWQMLEEYGSKQAPHFNRRLNNLVENQEKAAKEGLTEILGDKLTPEKLDKIALDYRIALDKKFSHFLDVNLEEHLHLIQSINQRAQKLTSNQEVTSNKIEFTEAFGIALEILGKDLQETQND